MGCMCLCLKIKIMLMRKKSEQELLYFDLVGGGMGGEGGGGYAAPKICLSTIIDC